MATTEIDYGQSVDLLATLATSPTETTVYIYSRNMHEEHYSISRMVFTLIGKIFLYTFFLVAFVVIIWRKRARNKALLVQVHPTLGVFFLTSLAMFALRGRRGRRDPKGGVNKAPVVVTSATHTTNDYTVTQMAVPVSGYQTNLYATPYPAQMGPPGHVQVQMPMPMPMQGVPPPTGYQPPYPTMHTMPPPSSMNPPSYDAAMSSTGAGANNMGYEKQSPYNPSFTAH